MINEGFWPGMEKSGEWGFASKPLYSCSSGLGRLIGKVETARIKGETGPKSFETLLQIFPSITSGLKANIRRPPQHHYAYIDMMVMMSSAIERFGEWGK